MKNVLASALAALVLTGSAFAYSPKDTAPQSNSTLKLVPTEVVHPSNLPRTFTRTTLMLEFTLDEKGQPKDIEIVSKADRAVRQQVVKAFKQWKFNPESATAGTRFVLPLEVVVSDV